MQVTDMAGLADAIRAGNAELVAALDNLYGLLAVHQVAQLALMKNANLRALPNDKDLEQLTEWVVQVQSHLRGMHQ